MSSTMCCGLTEDPEPATKTTRQLKSLQIAVRDNKRICVRSAAVALYWSSSRVGESDADIVSCAGRLGAVQDRQACANGCLCLVVRQLDEYRR